jgi:hypothetical protein
VSLIATATCDICGKTGKAEIGGFSYGAPPGWLAVSGRGPAITGDLPLEHRARQPDMCSWRCVAVHAARMAGEDEIALRLLAAG